MTVVILTLLTIEMVAFPMGWGHHGVSIDLPKTYHPINMLGANREDAIVIGILRDGKVFLGKEQVTATGLLDKINGRLNQHAERKVYIKADARVQYATVSMVLDAVSSAGIEKIGFLTDRRRNPTATQ